MLSKIHNSRTFIRSPLALAISTALALASTVAMAATVVDAPPDLTASKAFSTNGEVAPHLRNASRTPAQTSTKSKLEALPIYVAARKADGTLVEDAAKVHPMVITYTDTHESGRADDVFAAVSLDDGATWKHMNLSRSADKDTDYMVRKDDDVLSSDGAKLQAPGDVRKPSLRVDGNKILVTWTSKLCRSGDPTDIGDGPDPFQVKGSQGGVDYGATYDREDLGVVPFSCLWVARGLIEEDGAIKWFIPEQITSGRRDALQDVPFSVKDKGFAIVWQEDPVGLDPGQAAGSGEGMSGATVNHKTDIWYTYITSDLFDDVESIDDEYFADDGVGKLRPAVKFAHPVRLTDNMSCKIVGRNEDGTPIVNGLPICELQPAQYCKTSQKITTGSGETSEFCVTAGGVVLDGDTGASRPNLFMFPKGTTALVGLGYEETKGVGEGNQGGESESDDPYASGKLVRYHYFSDFTKPQVMQPGYILNRPAMGLDADGNKVVLEWSPGSPKYENARRVRFILQSTNGCGGATNCTTMAAVFKQGIDGKGAESDVMMVRAKDGYDIKNLVLDGDYPEVQNVSSPTTIAGYITTENDGVLKPQFKWIAGDLRTESWENRDDDARAQRGVLRGKTLLLGFTWTANQDAALQGNDRYDFYVRWSDDGGARDSWRTDKADPTALEVHNVSKLPNNKSTVIEPRTIGTPGSILTDGTFYSPDDRQNPNVFHLAYGTASNIDTKLNDDEEADPVLPEETDLFHTWTEDAGRTYKTVYNNSTGLPENAKLAARNDAFEGEVQLRTVPSGLKLYAVWNHEGPVDTTGQPIDGTGPIDGSDVGFRKITNLPDLYDLNGDGKVDISDQIVFRAAMGACEGKNKYNPAMDYDNDKCITLGDYAKFEEANRADD